MENKRVIAVIGATGAQGGGLVRAILNDPESGFIARAITRNSNSDKARELAALGAEVVEADVDDSESLIKAFEGAYGVFCVTFFWEHFSPEKEKTHAMNMAQAAAAAGAKHVIWSSLEDSRKWIPLDDDRIPTLMGKYKVPHFDVKGESNVYFEESNIPYTILNTSFYWENFIYFGSGPQKTPDGNLVLTIPLADQKLPCIAASDIGKCALGIFKAGATYQGKTIGISGEHLSGQQLADGLSEVLGQNVIYHPVPTSVYRTFGFPGADDIANMFHFNVDFADYFCSIRDVDHSRKLNPELLGYKDWLNLNKKKLEEVIL